MARRRSGSPPPLPTGDEKTARVRAMFDTIAPRYDLINRIMTFGLDQAWRRGTVAALALPEGARVLDLACGTGDLSRLALRCGYRVIGADLSAGMLGANGAATPLVEADGSRLPFVDGAFDGLVCGYALRNFTDLAATLAESARVLRAGGRLAVLEVDTPSGRLWRAGYDVWFTKAVPALGAALSDKEAYRYLPQSVAYLPPTPVLRAMLRAAGFSAVGIRPLAGGLSQLVVATRAGAAVTAALHARTVPLEFGPDALEFDGSPTVLFDRPGLTLVGWGTARLVAAHEAAAALGTIPCDDAVGTLGSGPVALGALPFRDALDGHLVIPRFTMGTSRDVDGVTRRWATAVGPAETALPDTDELFDAVIWQYGTTPRAVAEPTEAGVAELTAPMTSAGYAAMVAEAVAVMAAPGAVLHKVVLSRPVEVRLRGPLSLAAVLRRLRAGEPNCTVFSMPTPDGSFFGASPELLVARHGTRVASHPLAGTVSRGTTARADADAQRDLARSAKNREEHRFVVDEIAAALGPFCTELSVPAEPSVVAFRSVAHLGTRIEGRLAEPVGVLELVQRLHPTPAVGGTPRADALAFIARHEAGARGHWAGPVGWVGADGDGEWMIGIRSARLDADGAALTLRAGGGIVADSDPAAEAAEANVKLATVLEAVVPGASVQLR